MLLRYFISSRRSIYYVIPMSVLVSTLVCRRPHDEEQRARRHKACGNEPPCAWRRARVFALVASGLLGLQEQSAHSNREADRLNRMIRGMPPQSFGVLDRRWISGEEGGIYHYDPSTRGRTSSRSSTYQLDSKVWRLSR